MNTSDDQRLDPLQAALAYAALGWPVLPGALWKDGHFVDPATGEAAKPYLGALDSATTDTALIRQWWSTSDSEAPNVLTVTSPQLGAVSLYTDLFDRLARHPWFLTRPTPVLALPDIPIVYLLVRPPVPSMFATNEARVLADEMPLPLPPTAIGDTAATWLVSPEEAGNVMLVGNELADMLEAVEGAKA